MRVGPRVNSCQELWDGDEYLGLAVRAAGSAGWLVYLYSGDRVAARGLSVTARRDLSRDYVDCGSCDGLSAAYALLHGMARRVDPAPAPVVPVVRPAGLVSGPKPVDTGSSRITCPNCARDFLSEGVGSFAGVFVCPVCMHVFGGMVLAVRLLNEGRGLEEAAARTGLSPESVRVNLRMNYRRVGEGALARWVDRGVLAPSGEGVAA